MHPYLALAHWELRRYTKSGTKSYYQEIHTLMTLVFNSPREKFTSENEHNRINIRKYWMATGCHSGSEFVCTRN